MGNDDMPTLNWLTREDDLKTSSRVPYRLLEEVPELGYGDPANENMLIQGDNLEALKALLPFYAGKVKCIFIDPPYNTDNTFEHYEDNLEHSQWLAVMYPRLELLRDLLSEDGTLWIMIDDNELGYLTAIADEVIGRKNRIALVSFKQSSISGPKSINPGLVSTASYILYYAKNRSSWNPNRIFQQTYRDDRYSRYIENIEDKPEQWNLIPLREAFAASLRMDSSLLKSELGDEYESSLLEFVLSDPRRVVRTARVAPQDINEEARQALASSQAQLGRVFVSERSNRENYFFLNGEQLVFYGTKVQKMNGQLVTALPASTIWDDLLSNNLHKEGDVVFPKGKKPEALVQRILSHASNKGDLVLDSFLGSGTTAAVAHKMKRLYIGIERGEHALTHCVPRIKAVVKGEQTGISKSEEWQGGGGFRFYRLGKTVFDADGKINAGIRFEHLAAHVWFSETRTPLPKPKRSPLLGVHDGTAYFLLYNGVLGDKRPDGGNVLTRKVLAALDALAPGHVGPRVVYGESSRIQPESLKALGITFKQTPYDVRSR